MNGENPGCCRKLRAGSAARLRRAACTAAGAVVATCCVLATAAAAPAAVPWAGHGSLASPAWSARHRSHAPAAAAASLWIRIAAGGYHTCGIREGNTLWCWGAAVDGELGTGAATDQ